MRIIKITEKSTTPDEEGLWRVYGMVQIGNSFQYGVLLYQTENEAKKAKQGSLVDVEKVMFSRRTNNIISNELDELEAENRELKDEILRLSSELASVNKHFDTLNFYHDKICKKSRIKEDLLRNLLYTSSIPFYKKYFFKLKLWLIRKCL